ncbi:MAG: hypothetical protein P4L51_27495, partial [Puia sp.]|nr:hypothetical protein [Puia sp.]
MEKAWGLPGSRVTPMFRHAMVSDPGEADSTLPFAVITVLTSVILNCVVLPVAALSRLIPFNLSAYGLPACCPTLKARCYHQTSKDSLPGGGLDLPGRASHPLGYATLPGRTQGLTP